MLATALASFLLPPLGAARQPDLRLVETVQGEVGKGIDETISRLEKFGFSGVGLVARGGEVLLAKGYGLADCEKGVPCTVETVFSVGSITKQFTAAAILKLEMEGKLAVEDPISKHLPGVPPDKAGITLHHLLTHSSGLRSDFAEGDFEPVGREEYVRRALASPLLFEPGTSYAYSNAGYSLLGAIVELRSGKGYEAYLRAALFEPAGMLRTGYRIPKWRPEDLLVGYRAGERWGTILERPMAEDGPYWALRANGGIHTTLGDMLRWHLALEGDAVLSTEARRKLFTPHVAEGPEGRSHYGYGWAIFKTPRGTKLVAHNGGNGIFAADFRRYVDEGALLLLASSNAEMPAIALSNHVARILFGDREPLPPRVVDLDRAGLKRCAGNYRLPSGSSIRVDARERGLALGASQPDALALLLGAGAGGELATRVEAIVRSASAGDFAALHAAVRASVPVAAFAEAEASVWSRWKAELGAFRAVKAVARPGREGIVRAFACLEFEKGTRLLEEEWDEGVLASVRVREEPLTREIFPESALGFVAFDLPRWETWRVRFEVDAYGAPARLVLPAEGGEVAAVRKP
ncbi:MAG TPA: serine hydrolase domain-containing protein [Planctomycetota bacterium]|jgi:CubicO group peptidase (beta-lactamase class C family)|nr:serine hydrolase domain-containing protein [Planctomycetota bacterium]